MVVARALQDRVDHGIMQASIPLGIWAVRSMTVARKTQFNRTWTLVGVPTLVTGGTRVSVVLR